MPIRNPKKKIERRRKEKCSYAREKSAVIFLCSDFVFFFIKCIGTKFFIKTISIVM